MSASYFEIMKVINRMNMSEEKKEEIGRVMAGLELNDKEKKNEVVQIPGENVFSGNSEEVCGDESA